MICPWDPARPQVKRRLLSKLRTCNLCSSEALSYTYSGQTALTPGLYSLTLDERMKEDQQVYPDSKWTKDNRSHLKLPGQSPRTSPHRCRVFYVELREGEEKQVDPIRCSPTKIYTIRKSLIQDLCYELFYNAKVGQLIYDICHSPTQYTYLICMCGQLGLLLHI